MYYYGTLQECTDAIAQIDSNCGWPNSYVTTWAAPRETTTVGVYAFEMPTGSHGFTQASMIAGVTLATGDVTFPEIQ